MGSKSDQLGRSLFAATRASYASVVLTLTIDNTYMTLTDWTDTEKAFDRKITSRN